MRISLPLRARITAGLFAFSLVSSIGFGFAVYWAADLMEVLVLENNLGAVATEIKESALAGRALELPSQSWFYGVLEDGGELSPALIALSTGSHHDVIIDGREHHVWIEALPSDRLFLIYDLAEIETYEGHVIMFLVITITVLGLGALALGYLATPWIARPLSNLAARIASLPANAGGLPGVGAEDRDLRIVTTALDRYIFDKRLLLERERQFTDAASHELRTPLASIAAALDVLSLVDLPEIAQAPLARIERAKTRMTDLVKALLDMARSTEQCATGRSSCRPAALLREVVEDKRELAAAHRHKVELELDEALVLPVSPTFFRIVSSNLVANAFQHYADSCVRIVVDESGFSVTNLGGRAMKRQGERSVGGLGLLIVDSACRRVGWTAELSQGEGKSVARVNFR